MPELLTFLWQKGVLGSIFTIVRIALVLIPVLVIIELAKHYNLLEKISKKAEPLLRFLTLPKEAAFPLVIGMGFGIVYGAALIIDYSREGYLHKRDLLLIGVFLSISHAVFEDTLVFASLGANPIVILAARFILAVLITRLAAFFVDRRRASTGRLFTKKRAQLPEETK